MQKQRWTKSCSSCKQPSTTTLQTSTFTSHSKDQGETGSGWGAADNIHEELFIDSRFGIRSSQLLHWSILINGEETLRGGRLKVKSYRCRGEKSFRLPQSYGRTVVPATVLLHSPVQWLGGRNVGVAPDGHWADSSGKMCHDII